VTHILNTHSLFTVNPYLRQDNFHYYPSKNPFSDTPATLAQSRRLQNAGIKGGLLVFARDQHREGGWDALPHVPA